MGSGLYFCLFNRNAFILYQFYAQICVRIDVGSENGAALVGVKSCERGGERRFADAALAGDRALHTQMPSAARFCSMRSIMRSPSFSMSVSTV